MLPRMKKYLYINFVTFRIVNNNFSFGLPLRPTPTPTASQHLLTQLQPQLLPCLGNIWLLLLFAVPHISLCLSCSQAVCGRRFKFQSQIYVISCAVYFCLCKYFWPLLKQNKSIICLTWLSQFVFSPHLRAELSHKALQMYYKSRPTLKLSDLLCSHITWAGHARLVYATTVALAAAYAS